MSLIHIKCPNCGGNMKYDNNQYVCDYCGSMVLNIIDAKIDADINVISVEEFSKVLSLNEKKFIINVDDKITEFDIDSLVLNKKIKDAKAALERCNFEKVESILQDTPSTLLSVCRLKLLSTYHARNEYELSYYSGDIAEDTNFNYLIENSDAQTKETYLKIASICRENLKIDHEIDEGNKLIRVELYEEALTYARKMVHDYSAKSKSWAFFCRVNFLINSDYDASEILKIIYKCPDYQYNNNSDESFADNIRDFVHRTFIRKETKKADRKKKFKIISIVVLSVILFVGISIFLFFSINYYVTTVKPNINGINYSLDDDGYILTKYDVTDAEEIVIPNEINGKRIIDVAEGALLNCQNVKKLTISHVNYSELERSGLSYLFGNKIPQTLKTVVLTDCTEIAAHAFYNCSMLEEIILPETVATLNDYAFSGCSGLKSFTIPNTVEYIGEGIFRGCDNITEIITPFLGYSSIIAHGSLTDFFGPSVPQSLKTVTVFDDTIYNSAFRDCQYIETVIAPNATRIENYAFSDCLSLNNIIMENVTYIASGALNDTAFYKNEANWYDNALYFNNILYKVKTDTSGIYTVRDGTVYINDDAFYGCDISGVILPDTIISIGDNAFMHCEELATINLPDGLTNIGSNVFGYCLKLEELHIPISVTLIGDYLCGIRSGDGFIGFGVTIYCEVAEKPEGWHDRWSWGNIKAVYWKNEW